MEYIVEILYGLPLQLQSHLIYNKWSRERTVESWGVRVHLRTPPTYDPKTLCHLSLLPSARRCIGCFRIKTIIIKMICLGRRSTHKDNNIEMEFRGNAMVPLNAYPLFANAKLNNYFRIDFFHCFGQIAFYCTGFKSIFSPFLFVQATQNLNFIQLKVLFCYTYDSILLALCVYNCAVACNWGECIHHSVWMCVRCNICIHMSQKMFAYEIVNAVFFPLILRLLLPLQLCSPHNIPFYLFFCVAAVVRYKHHAAPFIPFAHFLRTLSQKRIYKIEMAQQNNRNIHDTTVMLKASTH